MASSQECGEPMIAQATFMKSVEVIDITNGQKQFIRPGEYETEEIQHSPHPDMPTRQYVVLKGSKLGSIVEWWLSQEHQGLAKLVRIEAADKMIEGIRLPIKSRSQLTPEQMGTIICGWIYKGRFICNWCAKAKDLTYPEGIKVYPINIIPYSQNCKECGLQVFDIWKRIRTGGPLNLFD
jgi:hypothetical protein